jgi:DnaK suppressor protein
VKAQTPARKVSSKTASAKAKRSNPAPAAKARPQPAKTAAKPKVTLVKATPVKKTATAIARPSAPVRAASKPAPVKPAVKSAAKPTAKPVVKPALKTTTKPTPNPKAQAKAVTKVPAKKPASTALAVAPAKPVLPATPQGSKATFTPSHMSVTLSQAPVAQTIKKNPKLANNWKSKALEALSDEEVVAMPDEEYMNATQLAFFRLKLQQLKREILSSAGETTEHLREDTVVVPDPADRATIEEEHALELRTRDRERKLLKKIEQSIQRIDAGDYGYCDETGEPIGVSRLIARPTASLSLEAQQRRELKQKMFGD